MCSCKCTVNDRCGENQSLHARIRDRTASKADNARGFVALVTRVMFIYTGTCIFILSYIITNFLGRHILRELCIPCGSTQEEAVNIPSVLREKLRTTPLPLSVDPTGNKNRRTARVQALTKQYGDNPEAVYVDAADYPDNSVMAVVVVDHTGKILSSATVFTANCASAEQAAIALAIITTRAKYIISDSKAAMRRYTKGRISQVAARILQQLRAHNYRATRLVWTPAHEGLRGNELAPTAACEIVHRAALNTSAVATERSHKFAP